MSWSEFAGLSPAAAPLLTPLRGVKLRGAGAASPRAAILPATSSYSRTSPAWRCFRSVSSNACWAAIIASRWADGEAAPPDPQLGEAIGDAAGDRPTGNPAGAGAWPKAIAGAGP